MEAIAVAMTLVLLPQEDKGQEEDKSTQGDEKDKGQGHLCHVLGLHPDQGLDQGQDTGKVDMMVRYRLLCVFCCTLYMFCLIEVMVEGKKNTTCCLNSYLKGYRNSCFLHPLSLSTADKDYHQSQKENHTQPVYHPSFTQPPTYNEHVTMTPGRSYHLSDITFTSALNGGPVQSGKNRSRSASGTGAYMNETAQQKYLRLKERQRKLKILRRGLMSEGFDGHDLLTLNPDLPWSDTRSVLSGMSFTQGEIECFIL